MPSFIRKFDRSSSQSAGHPKGWPFVSQALTFASPNFNIATQQQTEVSVNQGLKVNKGEVVKVTLEDLQMTTTIIGIIITALAIEVDKLTQYRHSGFPLVAMGGVLTVVLSLAL